MKKIKNLPLKSRQVSLLKKSGNKFLLKSFHTQSAQDNLTGQENYFEDLAHAVYRTRSGIRDNARAWKFIFKHLFFAKLLFNKVEKETQNKIYVLDIGCSKGYFRKVLESNINHGEQIVYFGVDLRKNALEEAVCDESIDSGAKGDKIQSIYIWHDAAQEFPLKSDSFDFVICSQTIKYLEKEKVSFLLSEIYRLLKKDGVLLLSNGLMFNQKINLEVINRLKKREEHYWTTRELMKVFKKNKFRKIEIYGGEIKFKRLIENIKPEEKKLINKFRKIFPDEIVESIFGFFYPDLSGVKVFVLRK